MREVKVNANKFEGYAVTLEIKGNTEEYAMSFLHIFNNVRESKELFKVENFYGSNDVTVYCDKEVREELIKYLENFGHVKHYERVLMYQMHEPDFDINKYDDVEVVPYFE